MRSAPAHARITLQDAKNASLRALVLEIPAPVIAETWGYFYAFADQNRQNAGARFADYVDKRNPSTSL